MNETLSASEVKMSKLWSTVARAAGLLDRTWLPNSGPWTQQSSGTSGDPRTSLRPVFFFSEGESAHFAELACSLINTYKAFST